MDGAFWAFLSFWAFLFFFLAKTFSSMRRSVWHAQARRPTLSVGVTGCREHVAPHFPVNALRRFSGTNRPAVALPSASARVLTRATHES